MKTRISRQLKRELARKAKALDMTSSAIVRMALRRFIWPSKAA